MPKYGKWRQDYQKFKLISVTYPIWSQPGLKTLSQRQTQEKQDIIQIIIQEQAIWYMKKP